MKEQSVLSQLVATDVAGEYHISTHTEVSIEKMEYLQIVD